MTGNVLFWTFQHWTALCICGRLACGRAGVSQLEVGAKCVKDLPHNISHTDAATSKRQQMSIPLFLLEGSVVVSAVVTLLTNFSVLICFTQSAELRAHVPGIFILNLSISNIILALINMPVTFLGLASTAKPLGDPLCRAVSFIETLINCNAMLSMAAISVDRWVAVVFPLRYSNKMRHRHAFLIVSYSWFQSLTFPLTQLMMGWGAYSHTYA